MAKQNPCSRLQQRQILKKKLCKIYEAIFCLSCEGGGNAWKIAPLCITWVGLLRRPHTHYTALKRIHFLLGGRADVIHCMRLYTFRTEGLGKGFSFAHIKIYIFLKNKIKIVLVPFRVKIHSVTSNYLILYKAQNSVGK